VEEAAIDGDELARALGRQHDLEVDLAGVRKVNRSLWDALRATQVESAERQERADRLHEQNADLRVEIAELHERVNELAAALTDTKQHESTPRLNRAERRRQARRKRW
jgi:hypothetical protein